MNPNPPNLDELQSIADWLRGANLRSRTQEDVNTRLDRLLHSYSPLAIERSAEQVWYRARPALNEDGFSQISELIHHETGSPTYGRASFPNQPVLYASWNILTALEEIRAEPNQFIQIISLRPRLGIQFACAVLGELQSIFHSGGSTINSRKLEQSVRQRIEQPDVRLIEDVFVDSFLAEQFHRRAEHPSEYKLTASYAQHHWNRKVGLIYPSVQAHQNVNLAVAGSEFFENFEVMGSVLLHVTQYFNYGLFKYRCVKQTVDIDESGVFVWSAESEVSYRVSPAGGVILDPHRKGWRKKDS